SATFGNDVARLSADMLDQPRRIDVGAVAKPVDTVRQRLYTVHQERKLELLQQLLKEENIPSALIFLRTKHRTDAVTFASPGDHLQLNAIEKALGKNLPRTEWEGEAPVLSLFRPAGIARPKSGFRRQRSLLRQR
ncbi:MAG TPA: hypothetical protein VMZ06_06125, partial [Candidatus Bathyarchaeia archaeon]|nr:hypothetical protein [Candidatus Bathyarchaeia archaeon]